MMWMCIEIYIILFAAYVKHSSSRSTSRLRWPPETEGSYGNRRRNEGIKFSAENAIANNNHMNDVCPHRESRHGYKPR